jgi:hypothetical protein
VAWAGSKSALWAAVLAACAVPGCADLVLIYHQDFELKRIDEPAGVEGLEDGKDNNSGGKSGGGPSKSRKSLPDVKSAPTQIR